MHHFAHIELPAKDLKRATEFYGKLFHWNFQTYFGDDYLLFANEDGEMIGGLCRVDKIPEIIGFHNYIAVADLGATLRQAEQLGGKTITPPTELPEGFGHYAVLQSPDGYNLGIWMKAS